MMATGQEPLHFFCYIVECSDGSYYTGWTTNPERRVHTHNLGKGARYTRNRRPVKLVYLEERPNRGSAMQREADIKRLGRTEKEQLIEVNSDEQRNQRPHS